MGESRPYVVVLAGGEGSRLASLTRALYGQDLPKQFAVLAGRHSLMQTTVERAQLLTTLDRISVIVSAPHEKVARQQLAPYPGVELVVQPKNLDTAAGLLLPLIRILRRDADARVIFLPSDHYIANPTPLVEALLGTAKRSLRNRLAMVGVGPTAPEVEYGWIVRGKRIARSTAFEIEHFREKPAQHVADELWRSGGLWNTFIQAAPAQLLWQLARDHLPIHTRALERYAAAIGRIDEPGALDAAYRMMPAASFSRAVLDHARSLAVLPVEGSGWSDWGSPQRVFASLAGTREHETLLERIRRDREPAVAIAS
ncbi:MAG TPA: sugar phosphate nucleotidyltransferase [Kofleriaceae bacterium]|nr:sugar phosphate nucleotidyltransferase [Kofleriaceae bacterium]